MAEENDPFTEYKAEAASLSLDPEMTVKYCQDRAREDRHVKREIEERNAQIRAKLAAEEAARKAEAEEKEAARKAEAEEKDKARMHQIEMKRLELERLSTPRTPNASNTDSESGHGHPKLPYFDDKEDLDSYLFRFEKHAEALKWPKSEWHVYLASLLKGKALCVYHELSLTETLDYDKLKDSLLKRFQCSAEGFRTRFRAITPQKDEPMTHFCTRAEHLMDRWFQLAEIDTDFKKLRDLILQEQLLKSLSPTLQTFLKERKFTSAAEMMSVAERFREAHPAQSMSAKHGYDVWSASVGVDTGPHYLPSSQSSNKGGGRGYVRGQGYNRGGRGQFRCGGQFNHGGYQGSQNTSSSSHTDGTPVKQISQSSGSSSGGRTVPSGFPHRNNMHCVRCQKKGHTAKFCREPAPVAASNVGVVMSRCSTCNEAYKVSKSCGHPFDEAGSIVHGQEVSKANLVHCSGTVDGKPVQVMLDSGCTTVGVRKSLVSEDKYSGEVRHCKLFSGQVFTFPVAVIDLQCPNFSGTVEACVIDDPISDVVLGCIPGANFSVEDTHSAGAVQTRAQKKAAKKPFQMLHTADVPVIDMGPVEVAALQATDPSLSGCFVKAKEDKVYEDNCSVIEFVVQDGLLYRKFLSKKSKETTLQLIVPRDLRSAVLVAAHDSIFSGHMAAGSTFKRILPFFYWPGVRKDVTAYCRSCDICQRTFPKGRVQSQPLEQLPTIDIPFQRVGIDLVGPFAPASNRGHRWILTCVDFATRFPEAIPLKSIETESVAEALISIFSRVGFPEEILSDQGSQFTSDLMKSVMRLLSIRQIHSTPYHAQTNGLVERFNGTLKSMLKKVAHEKPADWDRYIPAALFAYREIPQSSTGFSPFELLFGRTPRGPSQILHDMWTGEASTPETKSTYQYVLDLRNDLAEMLKVAQESLQEAGCRYKKLYDRKAKSRTLKAGDEVLVFLPTDKNKLLLKWQGPFKVVKKVGMSDYVVLVRGKEKIFHINMLRQYVRRTSDLPDQPVNSCFLSAGVGVVMEDNTNVDGDVQSVEIKMVSISQAETFADVKVDPQLTESERVEALEVCKKHSKIMTDLPGETGLVEHPIPMTVDKVIHVKPYPLPFLSEQIVEQEVKKMLDLGVIEPSTSAFCSPLVLVKKRDGTVRFCVDYRALNRVTRFDAEPIPDMEEMFVRLKGKRFFSKIDLSKGYWQIPVRETDREKTAFQTPQGLFQFRRMPFGLVTAPMTFARMMRMLNLHENQAMNFFDDILIATEEWDEHLVALDQVLSKLGHHGLTVRPSKVEISFRELEFLGHMIGGDVMKPVQAKVSKILNLSVPNTKKQVRSLVGLVSYYRRYVPNFADLIAPLVELTKKNQPAKVKWTPGCQDAFDEIKKVLSSDPVVVLPDFSKSFILRTDASSRGLGAALLQVGSDDEVHPVLYASRKLLERETHYSTIERECLAIVWGIDKFSRYLFGREFSLQTDHRPLTYLQRSKTSNGRLMRWSLALQEYRFHILPIAGQSNLEADVLSRLFKE